MNDRAPDELIWKKALELGELEEGRVRSVTCGRLTVCMTHHAGKISAVQNACPHQGGPLGEGSIENGLLRCPWHGWDFNPHGGGSDGFEDGLATYPIEERADGIWVGLPAASVHVRTTSDVVAETLTNWGVRQVFGMVGHSNLGLADALRRRAEAGELSFYGIRHEGAAAFAVSAYGKLTGRPAACLSIAGPGATNLLTGLWDANVDRSPALALTGQVDTQVLGPGAFQEVDLGAAFGKVAQWSQAVLSTSRPAELANLACKSALLNRGVSHLIFPDEVQTLPAEAAAGSPEGRLAVRTIGPPREALDEACALLARAKRPVLIVGHGARFSMDAVLALAEAWNAPVITTFKGKGVVSDHHPLGCGVLGRSGTPIASYFMNEADVLLVLGASFSNHTGITPKIPTVQVDFEPMMLGKTHAVDVAVWGEIGVTVELLARELADRIRPVDQRPEIAARWKIWRTEKARRVEDTNGQGLASAAVFEALNSTVPADAILAVDVGNNTYSFGRYFECTQQSVLMSGYLGSIGFSLPAALGAWAATQEENGPFHGRKVVSISGDGGFGQYMGELLTAVKYGMNVTHVLLDNGQLGKITKEQRAGRHEVWQTSLHNPDFAAYAELCGALGLRVTSRDELVPAFERALAHPGPSLVAVSTDPELI